MLCSWYATLDEGERLRADAQLLGGQGYYVAAHALTRGLLTYVDGLGAAAWRFSTTPIGKPKIASALGRSKLRFRLLHTRGLVACAVGIDRDLGVDVMTATACWHAVFVAAAAMNIAATFMAVALLKPLRSSV